MELIVPPVYAAVRTSYLDHVSILMSKTANIDLSAPHKIMRLAYSTYLTIEERPRGGNRAIKTSWICEEDLMERDEPAGLRTHGEKTVIFEKREMNVELVIEQDALPHKVP